MFEGILRILSALLMGALIGATRERINRPAGLRTHALICMGSAFITYLSITVFSGESFGDPGRMTAQIVSGIGFLGAGTILKKGITVKGLTTAATLWVTAAIGIGFGSGEYMLSFFGGGLVLGIVIFLRPITYLLNPRTFSVLIMLENDPQLVSTVTNMLNKEGITISNFTVDIDSHEITLNILLAPEYRTKLRSLLSSILSIKGVKAMDVE